METYRIQHSIIEVANDGKKPGDIVNVTISFDKPDSEYKYVYNVCWFIGDTAKDMARVAFARYTLGVAPDRIIDKSGCGRHMMTSKQLESLYKQFENFIADCTQKEYNANKSSLVAVLSLIHKRINEASK